MRYLLSSGLTTENPVTYIKDIIKVNMLLLPNEIPYYSGGTKELISDILEVNLVSHISEEVKTIVNRVQDSFSDIKVQLDSVNIKGTYVEVRININDIIETYAIKRFNKERIN